MPELSSRMTISSRAELEGAQTSTCALGSSFLLISTGLATFKRPKTSAILPSSHGLTASLKAKLLLISLKVMLLSPFKAEMLARDSHQQLQVPIPSLPIKLLKRSKINKHHKKAQRDNLTTVETYECLAVS